MRCCNFSLIRDLIFVPNSLIMQGCFFFFAFVDTAGMEANSYFPVKDCDKKDVLQLIRRSYCQVIFTARAESVRERCERKIF